MWTNVINTSCANLDIMYKLFCSLVLTALARVTVSEKEIIEELIFCLQGIEGKFIKLEGKHGYKLDPKVRNYRWTELCIDKIDQRKWGGEVQLCLILRIVFCDARCNNSWTIEPILIKLIDRSNTIATLFCWVVLGSFEFVWVKLKEKFFFIIFLCHFYSSLITIRIEITYHWFSELMNKE